MATEAHTHTVLVVEDDPGALDGLVYYLQSRGLDAIAALGGEAALRYLRGELQPCVVVTDVVMPDLDGWELLAAVRADPMLSALPIVMCSGHSEHVSRALQAGARAYLPKPVDPVHVADAVVRYCRSGS